MLEAPQDSLPAPSVKASLPEDRRDVCKRHQDSCNQIAVTERQNSESATSLVNSEVDQRHVNHAEPSAASPSELFTGPTAISPLGQNVQDVDVNVYGGLTLDQDYSFAQSAMVGDPSLIQMFNQRSFTSGSAPVHGQNNSDNSLSYVLPVNNEFVPIRPMTRRHSLSRPSIQDITGLIDLYFVHFHPALPIIHKPTFSIGTASHAMLETLMAFGTLYRERNGQSGRQVAQDTAADKHWQTACSELEQIVEKPSQFKIPWVLQSWVLCVIFGTFTSKDVHIAKSRSMYRSLVDNARELQLLHQKLVLPPALLWSAGLSVTRAPGERLLTQKWVEYINQESIKLAIYSVYLMDLHLFAAGNLRPIIIATEFEWDLPWATELWDAENANDWWAGVSTHEKDILPSTSHILSDKTYRDQDYQAKSLLVATQAVLSGSPSTRLLSIMEASCFATLSIVANLECLVRDFTRCYYQLPPNLPDPSPFHVLTQRQNTQVFAALRVVWKIIDASMCASCSGACSSLWHAVQISCLSIKVSLSNPDDLIVGGIVEYNPTAGLITAAHLALGNYVTSRRSGPAGKRTGINVDGIMILLDDLLKAMRGISCVETPAWEGPWIFIQSFRLLLVLWRALRMSISELQVENGAVEREARFSCSVIVQAVTEAAQKYTTQLGSPDPSPGEEEDDPEVSYIRWMHMVCDRRCTWDIGHAMSEVLDEIMAMKTDVVSLRQ